jgi:outer membrane protein OmpA-like peptidoglycan-associated protein
MAKLTTAGKLTALILVAGVAFGGYSYWKSKGGGFDFAPSAKGTGTNVVEKVDLNNNAVENGPSSPVNVTMPGDDPGCSDQPEIRILHWAWNAHMGAMFAVGGPQSAKGSLACKYGVNVKWIRQDDSSKMQEALVAFAQALKNGESNPNEGAHFVTIMGDGGAQFLAGVNSTLRKLGPEYQAKVVGALGYSRGEDKLMGPAAWKSDPSASKGGVCSGYLRDGDWNIALKWLGDNGLKNNPDEKTYDPDALNWVAANDYLDAAEKYITGYSEVRPVVKNGKRTGATKRITVDSVVTWTPGDVNVATQKGGLQNIVSTKEYSTQMPCVVIGIDKWMRDHRDQVTNMLRAFLEGGDAVKGNQQAFVKATEIEDKVFHEKNTGPAYWERYYRGATDNDKTGMAVELGGSYANGLADALATFGLGSGTANLFEATYTAFGDLVVQQYPQLVPSYPPASQIMDLSYLKAVASKANVSSVAIKKAVPTPSPVKGGSKSSVLSRRTWNIPFNSGRATFSPGAARDLERMRRDLLIASGATVEIHGHTDNVGDPAANMSLSEARAFAVQNWLRARGAASFGPGRIQVFAHGSTQPVAPNTSNAGRAQNRRVEIVLKTNG